MDITEKEFHKALISYFKAYKKSAGGWTAAESDIIIKGLEKLTAIEQSISGREDFMVQIGKNFGIYGLKIQSIKLKKIK